MPFFLKINSQEEEKVAFREKEQMMKKINLKDTKFCGSIKL